MTNKEKLRMHAEIIYMKSGLRLIGYALLVVSIPFAALLLFTSEILGILEEAIL